MKNKNSTLEVQTASQQDVIPKLENDLSNFHIATTSSMKGRGDVKKQTKLGIEVTKDENYCEWYVQVRFLLFFSYYISASLDERLTFILH
ncbi:unnamed protein product [Brugia pahangi]|uniref:Uncharacterized protein n=1 Tax=Brugia pahangi TaxID=6280 RepID=A0A0N4T9F1_BRUPA|nr:unnamed protein product [Brugia pahangi]